MPTDPVRRALRVVVGKGIIRLLHQVIVWIALVVIGLTGIAQQHVIDLLRASLLRRHYAHYEEKRDMQQRYAVVLHNRALFELGKKLIRRVASQNALRRARHHPTVEESTPHASGEATQELRS